MGGRRNKDNEDEGRGGGRGRREGGERNRRGEEERDTEVGAQKLERCTGSIRLHANLVSRAWPTLRGE